MNDTAQTNQPAVVSQQPSVQKPGVVQGVQSDVNPGAQSTVQPPIQPPVQQTAADQQSPVQQPGTHQSQNSTQTQPKIVKLGQKVQTNFKGAPVGSDASVRLSTFEEVLDEIQAKVPHGVVQAVDNATNTLNPGQAVGTAKERLETGNSIDTVNIDAGAAVQAVEVEKNPEIPVEVESYLQRVEDHHDTAPTEVVIADGTAEVPSNNYPSKPVIVLPITQAEEKEGEKQPPKNSFRWLVEWSHKIVKMFTGKVIYKQEEQ